MVKDKYSAVWVSHSSINDFLTCPRLYFLRNVYKNSKTRRKMTIMTPPLALGQAVHEVVESLSLLPLDKRLNEPLKVKLEKVWSKVSGKLGGFNGEKQEREYKDRASEMLEMIEDNPGPVIKKAIKIKQELPYYWLSEDDNIILCGKIDWLEYLKNEDAVHIIDFKTGKYEENSRSLQLPIYKLLAEETQTKPVKKISYWYLDKDKKPVERKMPDMDVAREKILDTAKRIKLGRTIEYLKCPKNGCFACTPYERILGGEGELVGVSDFRQDIYVLD